jgi:hypothetical protein
MAADKGFSLPTAQQVMEKLALAEAEKASEHLRRQAAAEAEKKMLLEKLTKPSGMSDEEGSAAWRISSSGRRPTASPRCKSIAFRTHSARIVVAPSISRSRGGKRH